jgi:Bacterial protein of unknown function (DUF922)
MIGNVATMQEVMSHVTGWPRALQWQEFPRVVTSRVPPAQAECSASFQLVDMPLVRSGSGATINPTFRINVFINRSPMPGDTGTWVVRGRENDALLRHEQGHYDLAGLAAREYSRELLGLLGEGPMSPAAIPGRVNAMNDQIVRELATMNERYDDRTLGTNHGLNTRIQDGWNTFIPRHIANFLEPDLTWIEDLTIVLSG